MIFSKERPIKIKKPRTRRHPVVAFFVGTAKAGFLSILVGLGTSFFNWKTNVDTSLTANAANIESLHEQQDHNYQEVKGDLNYIRQGVDDLKRELMRRPHGR